MYYPPQLYAEAAAERQRTLLARADAERRYVSVQRSSLARGLVGRALIAAGTWLGGQPAPVRATSLTGTSPAVPATT